MDNDSDVLRAKSVKSLAIAPRGGGHGLWRDRYRFRFSAMARDATTARTAMDARASCEAYPPGGCGTAGFVRASEAGRRQGLAAGDARFDLPAASSPGHGWR